MLISLVVTVGKNFTWQTFFCRVYGESINFKHSVAFTDNKKKKKMTIIIGEFIVLQYKLLVSGMSQEMVWDNSCGRH